MQRLRPTLLILFLLLPALPAAPALADPPPGPAGLKPGCGYQPTADRSCYRKAKAGPNSTLVCVAGDLGADPWLVSSRLTGQPYGTYPDLSRPQVAQAARQRYGLTEPRPPGFWPLGGFDGPWAEGFWTAKEALQFFWDHPERRPRDLHLGSPEEWDGHCSQREQFDLAAFGGKDLIPAWQQARDGGPPPAARAQTDAPSPLLRARLRISPAAPDRGRELVFDGRTSKGSIAGYRWDFGDGRSATGATVRHTYAEPGRYTASLEITAQGCTQEPCRATTRQTVQVGSSRASSGRAAPDRAASDRAASGRAALAAKSPQALEPQEDPPHDCGPHPTCFFLVQNGRWTRFIPDPAFTGRLAVEAPP